MKPWFISTRPKNNWVQITNEESGANSGLVVSSRGAYGYIKNTLGNSIDDQIINLILNSDLKLISYGGSQDNNLNENILVVGVGEKVESIPAGSEFDPNENNVFLLYDLSTSSYHLRSFQTVNINRLTGRNMLYSFPGSFAILNQKNSQNDVNLGNDLAESLATSWLEAFNIKVKSINTNTYRNFSGAAWVKNLCFDNSGEKTWEFSRNFINKLATWHGNEFNWGVKYYRGKSITLWDTLRDFN